MKKRTLALLMSVFTVSLSACGQSTDSDTAELQKQIEELQKENAELKEQVASNDVSEGEAISTSDSTSDSIVEDVVEAITSNEETGPKVIYTSSEEEYYHILQSGEYDDYYSCTSSTSSYWPCTLYFKIEDNPLIDWSKIIDSGKKAQGEGIYADLKDTNAQCSFGFRRQSYDEINKGDTIYTDNINGLDFIILRHDYDNSFWCIYKLYDWLLFSIDPTGFYGKDTLSVISNKEIIDGCTDFLSNCVFVIGPEQEGEVHVSTTVGSY